jgi:steroid 5-alpha reductase family enzyme
LKAAIGALVVVVVVAVVSVALAVAVGTGPGIGIVWGLPLALVAVAIAVVENGIAWAIASARRTERFYDLVGSATFLSLVGLGASARVSEGRVDVVAMLPLALVAVWAMRLGSFLFARVHSVGSDGRFDELKLHPVRFAVPWALQALWVVVTVMPALVLSSSSSSSSGARSPFFVVGIAVWLVGFAIEVVADRQKDRFRLAGRQGGFIDTGLWRWSRHPNYFGEILLWTGLFVAGVDVYQGAQWAVVSSPLLVTLLLTSISGIPMLEARADARFGADAAYQAYKARTPVLVLRPPRR